MIRTQTRIPSSGELVVLGTADAAADTANLTAAFASASASGFIVKLIGTFVIRVPQAANWIYRGDEVHVCVPLYSNLHVRGIGRGTKIMVEQPSWGMPTGGRAMLFGTPVFTTTAGQMENIVFEDMMFDFTATYGTPPPFTYAFGVVGVNDFRRSNITFYSPGSPNRGRCLWAENCYRRSGFGLKYRNVVQGYYTHYEYDTTEMNIEVDGVAEFYDMDEGCVNWVGVGFKIKNSPSGDEIFDFASAQNLVLDDVALDNVGSVMYLYTKAENSWPTFEEWFKHVGTDPPQVTIDIPTGVVTWPVDADLVADGLVAFINTTGALPTGFALATLYYIVGSSISGLSAQLSATPGGAAIVTSGTQSGVHTMERYSSTPVHNKNIVVSNVVGTNLRTGFFDTVRISTNRVGFTRRAQSVQTTDLTLRGWRLTGGNRILINEGNNILLQDIVLNDFRPDLIGIPGYAIQAEQSLVNATAIAASILNLTLRDITIRNCIGGGVSANQATNLVMQNIVVDGYNEPDLDTATINIATGRVTWAGNMELTANERVAFTSTTGALPTGFSLNTIYYVVGADIINNSTTLSATSGGAAIATSGTQSGVHTIRRYLTLSGVYAERIGLKGNTSSSTATIDIATGRVTWPIQTALAANDTVQFTATTGALPTGFALSTVYYIVGSSISNWSAQLSATANGAAIATSGTQSGVHTIERSGLKLNGSVDIDGLNIYTSQPYSYDLQLKQNGTVAEGGFTTRIGENLRLRTTSTGSTNLVCTISDWFDDRKTFNLPAYTTTGPTDHFDTLLQSSKAYHLFLGASLINEAAIAGDAVNNSRLLVERSVAGTKSVIASAFFDIDDVAVAADTERYCTPTSTDADRLIAPGEALVSEVQLLGGTGSVTPKLQLRIAAIKFYQT